MESLSKEQASALESSRLTQPQVAALDALVARDVTLARQGGVTGFAVGFSARHTAKELSQAGVDRLSDAGRSTLDRLVSQAIAVGPSPVQAFTYDRPAPTAPVKEIDVTPPHMEVHGDVSLTVGGGGHGSSFYGTSMDVVAIDPSGRFTVGVGFSDFHSKGILTPCLPYYGGPAYPGW